MRELWQCRKIPPLKPFFFPNRFLLCFTRLVLLWKIELKSKMSILLFLLEEKQREQPRETGEECQHNGATTAAKYGRRSGSLGRWGIYRGRRESVDQQRHLRRQVLMTRSFMRKMWTDSQRDSSTVIDFHSRLRASEHHLFLLSNGEIPASGISIFP